MWPYFFAIGCHGPKIFRKTSTWGKEYRACSFVYPSSTFWYEELYFLLQVCNRYGITLNNKKRKPSTYSTATRASIRNEFATVAFRVGHTLVPSGMMPKDTGYTPFIDMAQ